MKRLGIVAIALAAASVLGIVLLGWVARWLTPDQNATFIAWWGVLFAGGSALSLIQQESARQAALADTAGQAVPRSVWQLAAVAFGIVTLLLLVLALTPAGRALFADYHWQSVAIMLLAFIGFSLQFLVNGIALGKRRERLYAIVVLAEPTLRLVGFLPFFLWISKPSPLWALLATALGSYGWLSVVAKLRLGLTQPGTTEPWGQVFSRVMLLGSANALLAALLTGYPALVTSLVGSSAGLAVFFAVVTVARVPLMLLSPVQALVIPETTRILAAGRVRELYGLLGKVFLALIVSAAAFALGGYLLGPWAVRLLFGSKYIASGTLVALILAASAVLAAAILQAAVFVSLERYVFAALTWGISLAFTVGTVLITPGTSLVRAGAGFVVASVASYLVSTLLLRMELGRRETSASTQP